MLYVLYGVTFRAQVTIFIAVIRAPEGGKGAARVKTLSPCEESVASARDKPPSGRGGRLANNSVLWDSRNSSNSLTSHPGSTGTSSRSINTSADSVSWSALTLPGTPT